MEVPCEICIITTNACDLPIILLEYLFLLMNNKSVLIKVSPLFIDCEGMIGSKWLWRSFCSFSVRSLLLFIYLFDYFELSFPLRFLFHHYEIPHFWQDVISSFHQSFWGLGINGSAAQPAAMSYVLKKEMHKTFTQSQQSKLLPFQSLFVVW